MAVKQACPFQGKHVLMALNASKPFALLPYERRIYDKYVMAESDPAMVDDICDPAHRRRNKLCVLEQGGEPAGGRVRSGVHQHRDRMLPPEWLSTHVYRTVANAAVSMKGRRLVNGRRPNTSVHAAGMCRMPCSGPRIRLAQAGPYRCWSRGRAQQR